VWSPLCLWVWFIQLDRWYMWLCIVWKSNTLFNSTTLRFHNCICIPSYKLGQTYNGNWSLMFIYRFDCSVPIPLLLECIPWDPFVYHTQECSPKVGMKTKIITNTVVHSTPVSTDHSKTLCCLTTKLLFGSPTAATKLVTLLPLCYSVGTFNLCYSISHQNWYCENNYNYWKYIFWGHINIIMGATNLT